jgi:hypothetical protein
MKTFVFTDFQMRREQILVNSYKWHIKGKTKHKTAYDAKYQPRTVIQMKESRRATNETSIKLMYYKTHKGWWGHNYIAGLLT